GARDRRVLLGRAEPVRSGPAVRRGTRRRGGELQRAARADRPVVGGGGRDVAAVEGDGDVGLEVVAGQEVAPGGRRVPRPEEELAAADGSLRIEAEAHV